MHSGNERKMFFLTQFLLNILALVTLVQCQLNGEFWWLNSKLNNLKKVRPDPPNIDVSDFQNDESARIVFRDDDLFSNNVLKPIKDRTSKLNVFVYPDENKVVWPNNEHMKNHDVEIVSTPEMNVTKSPSESVKWPKDMKTNDVEVFTPDNNLKDNVEETTRSNKKNDDVLVFFYPKKEKYVTADIKNTNAEPSTSTKNTPTEFEVQSANTELLNDKFSANMPTKESQNICTYITKAECFQQKGLVYEYARRLPVSSSNDPLICCVLPIQPVTIKPEFSFINFPMTNKKNRLKRSNAKENIALSQRDFLLRQRFPTAQKLKPVPTLQTKIVTSTEEDYVDPYWNIKNTKFQNKPKLENSKYDDYSEDYDQEYADEIPRPGLIGLYSDHAKSPSSWSAGGNKGFSYGGTDDYINEEDDEDDYSTFGYSTIDPRKGVKTQRPKLNKPQKLTTSSGEVSYDAESQTISFQSNPDFQVFQGFKLLNLFRNTSRTRDKNSNRFTDDDRSTETVLVGSGEEGFDETQLFNGCGKAKKAVERGSQSGEAANGAHPWLALVVLTKRRHNVLCYATLVHPRAAVTVADCVHGTLPDDITVITGLWNLEDRSRARNRVATVHVHPRYKPGSFDHNIAVLYWMRPLALSVNVQPACLGQPQIGDDCKFFGWGGLNQDVQQAHSRWQRVLIRACTGRVGTKISSGTFCASTPRGTVTGLGGPLICDIAGHSTIVGVVVSRDNDYILAPVRNWVMQAEDLLSGD